MVRRVSVLFVLLCLVVGCGDSNLEPLPYSSPDDPVNVEILRGPLEWSTESRAEFELRCGPEGCQLECRLQNEDFRICESPVLYEDLADGEYRFEARALFEGQSSSVASWQWQIDTSFPEIITLLGPEARTREGEARFDFQCSQQDCTYQCQLNQQSWESCAPGVEYKDLFDGTQRFSVRAENELGVQGPEKSLEWTIDRTLPEILNLLGPDELTSEDLASFSFSCSKEECDFFCRLNDGDFESCSPDITYEELDVGEQIFAVYGIDDLGNHGEETHYEWTIIRGAPQILALQGPSLSDFPGAEGMTASTSATFEWLCDQEQCIYECSLNQGEYEPCEPGVDFNDLQDGGQVFSVRAIGVDEIIGDAAQFEWIIDSVAPVITFDNGPLMLTNQVEATLAWSCSKTTCFQECSHQGDPFESCSSPLTISDLEAGLQTLSVRATDGVGNISAQVDYTWEIDLVLPVIENLVGPAEWSKEDHATFEFQCSKDNCEFICALQNEDDQVVVSPTSCASGITYNDLDDQIYTFSVFATDAAGNNSETLTYSWTLDREQPLLSFLATPPTETTDDHALFEFQCTNKSSCTYQCALSHDDGTGDPLVGSWVECDETYFVEGLEAGSYSLTIEAEDLAGNRGEFVHTWTVIPLSWSTTSAGAAHSCGVANNGTLWCWGANNNGQLGLGDIEDRLVPTQVGTATQWSEVSAGGSHTCGRQGGKLYCWGQNVYGQLGLNNNNPRFSPSQVGPFENWSQVTTGSFHSCGRRGGNLYCWGRNTNGQLGVGGSIGRAFPDAVDNLPGTAWSDVSAGVHHTCGIRDGSLFCWGMNSSGQLGLGHTNQRHTPNPVGDLTSWTKVSAGNGGTCAKRSGRLYCWGFAEDTTPSQVGSADNWSAVSLGGLHICGRREEELYCFRRNSFGQLGLGDRDDRVEPEQVTSRENWEFISAGARHSCGISEGELYCWGDNRRGQLGMDSDPGQKDRPTPIAAQDEFLKISSSFRGPGSCQAQANGTLQCWGGAHTCGIQTDGTLWCWGENNTGQLGLGHYETDTVPLQVGEASDWSEVSVGGEHTCGIRSGELYCWGSNQHGKLGLGVVGDQTTPHRVGTEADWSEISAGGAHTCGRRGGELYCWGRNFENQLGLGDGAGSSRDTPTRVGDEGDWSEISAGSQHTCGRRGGGLYCWGSSAAGALGLGSSTAENTPSPVGEDADWSQISAGSNYSCGLRGGDLYCWGGQGWGRLGLGDNDPRTIPTRVGTHSDWSDVSTAEVHTCARRGGELYCWGRNQMGGLGLGDEIDEDVSSILEPTRVGTSDQWTDITLGDSHSCGIKAGPLYCWGSNGAGRLGDYSLWRREPTPVVWDKGL